jgi:hypothetical protein
VDGRRDAPARDEAQAAPELDVREFLREDFEEVMVRRRRDAFQEAPAPTCPSTASRGA